MSVSAQRATPQQVNAGLDGLLHGPAYYLSELSRFDAPKPAALEYPPPHCSSITVLELQPQKKQASFLFGKLPKHGELVVCTRSSITEKHFVFVESLPKNIKFFSQVLFRGCLKRNEWGAGYAT